MAKEIVDSILELTLSQDDGIRESARSTLENVASINRTNFLVAMSDVLVDQGNSEIARKAAIVQLQEHLIQIPPEECSEAVLNAIGKNNFNAHHGFYREMNGQLLLLLSIMSYISLKVLTSHTIESDVANFVVNFLGRVCRQNSRDLKHFGSQIFNVISAYLTSTRQNDNSRVAAFITLAAWLSFMDPKLRNDFVRERLKIILTDRSDEPLEILQAIGECRIILICELLNKPEGENAAPTGIEQQDAGHSSQNPVEIRRNTNESESSLESNPVTPRDPRYDDGRKVFESSEGSSSLNERNSILNAKKRKNSVSLYKKCLLNAVKTKKKKFG